MGSTIAPRPGVEGNIVLEYELEDRVGLTPEQKGKLQSKINDEFVEPNKLGQLAITFRSEVLQSEQIPLSVMVQTTTSELNEDIVYRMQTIIEEFTNTSVKTWKLRTSIDRKSFGIDEA